MGRTAAPLTVTPARCAKRPARAHAWPATSPTRPAVARGVRRGCARARSGTSWSTTPARRSRGRLRDIARRLAAAARRQPDRHVPLHQRVLPEMLERQVRPHRQRRLDRRAEGLRRVAAYCAAKHGVVGLTARRRGGDGEGRRRPSNAVCPGYTADTDIVRTQSTNVSRTTGRSPDEARAVLARYSPARRPHHAGGGRGHGGVAAVRRRASSITGQAIAVAGGGGDVMSSETATALSAGRSTDGVATDHAQPARAQEPADLRVLRRAARHVPRAAPRRPTCTRSCSTGAGGNFCSGGDVHEIIGPLVASASAATRRLLALHAHDRRPREGDARAARSRSSPRSTASAPAPARSWRWPATCASARRAAEVRVPVRARRPCRRRHGRLRDAAAHHRPGPRQRAALHRPGDGGAEGRALGLLQPARRARRRCSTEAPTLARSLAAGPTFAHAMTKTMLHQEWDMTIDAAIEAEAQAQAICMQTEDFAPRLSRLRRQAAAGVRRATERAPTPPTVISTGRSSTTAHRGLAARAAAPGATRDLTHEDDADPSTPPAGHYVAQLGRGRLAAPRRAGSLRRRRRALDVRSLCLIRETLGYASGLADFAFAMQGLGSGRDRAVRRRARSKRPTCRRSPPAQAIAAFAISEPEAGSDVAAMQTTRPPRRRVYRHQRRPRPGSPTRGIADFYVVFCRCAARAASASFVGRSSSMPARPGLSMSADDRGDRAASARRR